MEGFILSYGLVSQKIHGVSLASVFDLSRFRELIEFFGSIGIYVLYGHDVIMLYRKERRVYIAYRDIYGTHVSSFVEVMNFVAAARNEGPLEVCNSYDNFANMMLKIRLRYCAQDRFAAADEILCAELRSCIELPEDILPTVFLYLHIQTDFFERRYEIAKRLYFS